MKIGSGGCNEEDTIYRKSDCQCAVTESLLFPLEPFAWSWLPSDFLRLLFANCFRMKMVGAAGIEPATPAV